MDTVIRLENVSKIYNVYRSNIERIKSVMLGREPAEVNIALKNVSLEIKKGEKVFVFGVVDSGRTTLLKVIAGITSASKGKVTADCSQNVMLDPKAGIDMEFSCRENIMLRANIADISKAEIGPQVESILKECECEDFADLPLKRAPKGSHARLALAVHLKKDAEILLIDGTFIGGGNYVATMCENSIIDYMNKNPDVTTVIVTNRSDFAIRTGTRGIVLNNGELIFDGDVREAAERFGSINESVKQKKKEQERTGK